MRTQILYDQGSASVAEDRVIYESFSHLLHCGVLDGITGVYLPKECPKIFDGKTGGQFAVDFISLFFKSLSLARPTESLELILEKTNNALGEHSELYGVFLEQSEFLPSAAFVIASIDEGTITIIQGGDSLAVWQKRDGTIGGTSNKTFSYEKKLRSIIAELMEKHHGDREKMWEEFRLILITERRANINTPQGGFALLNGQSQSKDFWQKFELKREEIKLLLLFSDGFVPFEGTENEKTMGEELIHSYYWHGRLDSILTNTRLIEEGRKF